jgi:hypothetical protein
MPDDAGRLAAIAEKQIEGPKASEIFFDHRVHTWRVPRCSRRCAKAMKGKGLLSDSEHPVTRLQLLNLTDSQRDAITWNYAIPNPTRLRSPELVWHLT